MGKIDNKKITLQGFVDQYINFAKRLRIMTGCVSKGPVEWILRRLPLSSNLFIVAGSIAPDLMQELDKIFLDSSESPKIGNALIANRLWLGLNREIHMKIWLFELENRGEQSCLTIWGSSNLTWQGLCNRKGEQNDWTLEYSRFALEESQWNHFKPGVDWITSLNWTDLRNKCWNPAPSYISQREVSLKFSGEVEIIQQIVAEFFNLNVEEIKSKKRSQRLVLPRQIAMYLAKELTTLSYPEIGMKFGKDHTTILYAYQKIKENLENDIQVQETIKRLKEKLNPLLHKTGFV